LFATGPDQVTRWVTLLAGQQSHLSQEALLERVVAASDFIAYE
jgi:hypothetical protein